MVTFKSLKDSRVFQVETIPYSVSVGDKVCFMLADYRPHINDTYVLEGTVVSVEHFAKRVITSDMDVRNHEYNEYNLVVSVL